jgi:hypothetical protein
MLPFATQSLRGGHGNDDGEAPRARRGGDRAKDLSATAKERALYEMLDALVAANEAYLRAVG